MTMKEPRLVGPQVSARDLAAEERECTVAAQALCRGHLDTRVVGVTGAAARGGREHIALRIGRVLLYLEDRAALETLNAALDQANGLADRVFGPAEDAFTEAERGSRRYFERTGKLSKSESRRTD